MKTQISIELRTGQPMNIAYLNPYYQDIQEFCRMRFGRSLGYGALMGTRTHECKLEST